jgi:ADP-ribosylglycohydrolase
VPPPAGEPDTGTIAGNILGVALGVEAVPTDLLENLEERKTITQIGSDLADVFVDGNAPAPERYPTW